MSMKENLIQSNETKMNWDSLKKKRTLKLTSVQNILHHMLKML